MASQFWLAAYIIQLFDYHFSLVYFRGLKYNLANQILQNVQQNDNDRIYFTMYSILRHLLDRRSRLWKGVYKIHNSKALETWL